jgi:hypothetical protein
MPRKPKPKSDRKKGAQPGNTNAIKNSIYSRFTAVVDSDELAAMPRNNWNHELDLIRSQIVDRLGKRESALDEELSIKYDTGARHYIQMTIDALIQNSNRRLSEKMQFTSLMDSMLAQNDKQNVQR